MPPIDLLRQKLFSALMHQTPTSRQQRGVLVSMESNARAIDDERRQILEQEKKQKARDA